MFVSVRSTASCWLCTSLFSSSLSVDLEDVVKLHYCHSSVSRIWVEEGRLELGFRGAGSMENGGHEHSPRSRTVLLTSHRTGFSSF